MTIVDDKNVAIKDGDRVMTTCYGGRIPKWLSRTPGRVVGFTRRGQVKVKFIAEVYDEEFPYRSVPPSYLRVIPEDLKVVC